MYQYSYYLTLNEMIALVLCNLQDIDLLQFIYQAIFCIFQATTGSILTVVLGMMLF